MLPLLLVFCGIPGSGKTTIARIVSKKLRNTVHVQTDTVRFMLSKPTYTGEESEFVYDCCVTVAGMALKRGYNTILDGTFLRDEYRREALQKLEGSCDAYKVVGVLCEVGIAYKRNGSRMRKVPKHRFEHLYSRFEVPREGILLDSSVEPPAQTAGILMRKLRDEGLI